MKSYYDIEQFKKTLDLESLTSDEVFDLSCKFILDKFEFNDNNFEFFKNLKFYFDKDIKCNKDLNKGLLIVGGFGTGKTTAMQIFWLYTILLKLRNSFRYLNSDVIIDSFSLKGRGILRDFNYSENILIDELGEDTGKHYYFGSVEDPVEILLAKRYDMFVDRGYKTHAITNLDVNSLQKRFSGKIYDRICQMFNIVPLVGDSWRRKP